MYLQEKLPCSWIKYKDCTIYGFSGEISLKCFMNSNSIDICVVNEPDDLITEDLTIVLR